MTQEHDFTGTELRAIDEAIYFIKDNINSARKYYRHERFVDAKSELDELIENIKAWKESYEP
jgi:hypothetical protein